METLLSVQDVATLLRLSPRTVYNLVARRAIPVQRVRRRVYFRRSELEQWLQPQAVHPLRALERRRMERRADTVRPLNAHKRREVKTDD